MAEMLTRQDIVDLWRTLYQRYHLRVDIMQEQADLDRREEREEGRNALEQLDTLSEILGKVQNQDKLKHDDMCWQRHAGCLRDYIHNTLG